MSRWTVLGRPAPPPEAAKTPLLHLPSSSASSILSGWTDITAKAPSLPVRVTVDGMATGFGVADSSFVRRADAPEIRTDVLATTDGLTRCYASVHFPSMPLSAKADTPAAWHWNVYVTLPDGTVTQSVLSMPDPLLAGELAILKGMVQDTGVVTTEDPDVGVSVTLDWHQGMEIPVDF